MISEAPATFEAYARFDDERNTPALDLPTREEVENGQPTLQATAEQFTITDEASASWYVGKRADIEARRIRIKTQAAERLAQLDADERSLKAKFEEPLRVWAEAEAQRRRRKTVTLLDGTLTFRAVPAKFVIADGEACFVNARTVCPAAIVEQTTVTLDKAAYIAYAEATGDMTGLDHQPEREAFAVKFATGAGKENGTDG